MWVRKVVDGWAARMHINIYGCSQYLHKNIEYINLLLHLIHFEMSVQHYYVIYFQTIWAAGIVFFFFLWLQFEIRSYFIIKELSKAYKPTNFQLRYTRLELNRAKNFKFWDIVFLLTFFASVTIDSGVERYITIWTKSPPHKKLIRRVTNVVYKCKNKFCG